MDDGGVERVEAVKEGFAALTGQDAAQRGGQRRPVRRCGALVEELEEVRRRFLPRLARGGDGSDHRFLFLQLACDVWLTVFGRQRGGGVEDLREGARDDPGVGLQSGQQVAEAHPLGQLRDFDHLRDR